MACFSPETMQVRKQWSSMFRVLERKQKQKQKQDLDLGI